MLLLMVLSYTTTFGLESNTEGIQFVINEGSIIGKRISPIIGTLFLFVVGVMLFQTQLGVMDSTSRIMAENVAIKKLGAKTEGTVNLCKIYYYFVWAQILFGIILFLLNIYEPKTLIVLGAIINAVAMFVHIGLVFILNQKELPKVFRPNWSRKIIMSFIFLFFGFFCVFVLLNKLGLI